MKHSVNIGRLSSKVVGMALLVMIWIVLAGVFSNCSIPTQVPTSAPLATLSGEQKTVEIPSVATENSSLAAPLDHFADRQQMITFGLHISPKTSPLPKPEVFTGYHTGLDLEILPGEENQDVPVYAISDGKILFAGKVSGYGGVVIENTVVGDQEVTVLYGHVSAGTSLVQVGDKVKKGQKLASLGAAYSPDTGGNRKHLHLGIHKGTSIEYKGYVQNQADLANWLNLTDFLQ